MYTRSIQTTVSAITAVALLLTAATASAAPYTILYEGVLTSGGGTPAADGEYGMTFSMYTKASGGTAFWQESNVKVKVTGGVFQYALGSSKPIFAPPLQQLDLAHHLRVLDAKHLVAGLGVHQLLAQLMPADQAMITKDSHENHNARHREGHHGHDQATNKS